MSTCIFPGCSKQVFPGSQFCSKGHRDNYGRGGGANTFGAGAGAGASKTCKFPGCSKPVYQGSDFCSRTHRDNYSGGGGGGGGGRGNTNMGNTGNAGNAGKTCIFPGCTKPVFPGSDFCTRTHRDSYTGGRGGNQQGNPGAGNAGKTCKFPGCSKPVFPGSDFCTRTHRDNYKGGGGNNNPGGAKTCKFYGCGKPVFPGSEFCTRTHRDSYAAGGGRGGGQQQGGGQQGQSLGTCIYPGCTKPAIPTSSFCSQPHRDDAPNKGCETCMWCRTKARNVLLPSLFCGRICGRQAQAAAPLLLMVKQGEQKYKTIEHEFQTNWQHTPTIPPIKNIYLVLNNKTTMSKYYNYRTNIENSRRFMSQGLLPGNEEHRFYATGRECTVGDNGSRQMCTSPTCPLCTIMRKSFSVNGVGGEQGSFGRGIYTFSTSSKADFNISNTRNLSSNQALLVAEVIRGLSASLTNDNQTLTAPPTGYDSVSALSIGPYKEATDKYFLKVARPGTFDDPDEEVVVYKEDGIVPGFLVIY